MKRSSIYQTLTSRTSQVRRQDNQVWDQTGLSGWRHVGVGVVLKGRVCVCVPPPQLFLMARTRCVPEPGSPEAGVRQVRQDDEQSSSAVASIYALLLHQTGTRC
jgi:hypothetical protein